MRARVHAAWALALPLLALPTLAAAAGAPAPLTLQASRMEVHGGATGLLLAGLAFTDNDCTSRPPAPLVGTAAHVRVQMDRFYQNGTIGDVSLVPPAAQPTLAPWTGEQFGNFHAPPQIFEADDATIEVSGFQAQCILLAWTDGTSATLAAAGNLSVQAAPDQPQVFTSPTTGAGIPIGGPGLLAAGTSAATLPATGTLKLDLYRVTLRITAGNQAFQATLGYEAHPHPMQPPLPGNDVVVDTVTSEATLTLTGAAIPLPVPSAGVLAARAHVDAPHGFAQFTDATLVASPAEQPHPYTVEGPRGDLRNDGTRLSYTTASAARAGTGLTVAGWHLPLWPLWAAGLAALALLGTRRLALRNLRRTLDAGRYADAARWALLVRPASAESRTAHVVCLLRLGRLDAAGRALHPRHWRSHRATRSFLQARLEASRGDAAAARRHLADCLILAPAFVADARADQQLNAVVEGALGRVRALQATGREGYA